MYERLRNNITTLKIHEKTHKPVLHITKYTQTEADVIYEIDEDVNLILEKIHNKTLVEMPFKVGDLIDKVFSHNEIIAIWIEDAKEIHYVKRIWRGMAHTLPEIIKGMQFKRIFGSVPESIYEADTINIEVELNRNNKKALAERTGKIEL